MLATLRMTLEIWKPAIISNIEEKFQDKAWKYGGLKNTTSLFLRTSGSFLLALPLCYRLFRHVGHSPLISRATLLSITPSFVGHPHLYSVAQLASLPLNMATTVVCATAAAFFYCYHEHRRAEKAVDAFAVEKFKSATHVNDEIMSYLTWHPDAVKNIIRTDSAGILTKQSQTATTLLDTALTQFCQERTKERALVIALLLDEMSNQRTKPSKETFKRIIQANFLPFLWKCLKEETTPADWDSQQTADAWRHVNNDLVAQLLLNSKLVNPQQLLIQELSKQIERNFDDVKAGVRKSYFSDLKSIYFLLKNGAVISDLDQTVGIKANPKEDTKKEGTQEKVVVQKTLNKWLKNEPHMQKALQQAQSRKALSGMPLLTTPSILSFWRPAVDAKFYSVDNGLIMFRTGIVAWTSFMSGLAVVLDSRLAASFLATLIVPSISTALLATLYHKYAWKSAITLLGNEAIFHYHRTRFHDPNVTHFICDHPKCIQYLIDNNLDLSKLDGTGRSLWNELLRSETLSGQRLESFKLMSTKLMKPNNTLVSLVEALDYLIQIIQSGQSAGVSYLLEAQLIQASEMADIYQHQCWRAVMDSWQSSQKQFALFQALLDGGFDINAKDQNGYTPLLALAGMSITDKYQLIQKLLELGANRHATVVVQGKKMSVVDFLNPSTEKSIIELIQANDK